MLRHEVREVESNRRRMWIPIGLVLLVVAVLVPLTFVVLGNSRANRDTLNVVQECTSPSEGDNVHECYEQSSARTATVVAEIIIMNSLAAECALEEAALPAEQRDILRCTLDKRDEIPVDLAQQIVEERTHP